MPICIFTLRRVIITELSFVTFSNTTAVTIPVSAVMVSDWPFGNVSLTFSPSQGVWFPNGRKSWPMHRSKNRNAASIAGRCSNICGFAGAPANGPRSRPPASSWRRSRPSGGWASRNQPHGKPVTSVEGCAYADEVNRLVCLQDVTGDAIRLVAGISCNLAT